MSEELTIVDKATGEVVSVADHEAMQMVAATKPHLIAELIGYIDESVRVANDTRSLLGEYLIERMDKDATQTLNDGDYKITVNGSSDDYETFDAQTLRSNLVRLVADGVLSDSAVDKAIRVKYEASKSGINSLSALRDDAVNAAIESSKTIAVKKRRITIKKGA